jgi:hypothetical protein
MIFDFWIFLNSFALQFIFWACFYLFPHHPRFTSCVFEFHISGIRLEAFF